MTFKLLTLRLMLMGILLCSISVADDGQQASQDAAQPVAQTTRSGPIVIAHRGASGYLPEHTTEAAALAHAMNVDFIEQDVVMSKDGIPVVLHDVTLNNVTNVAQVFPDRATDGKYYVFDFSLKELRGLNVVERRSTGIRFPQGKGRFQIRTLDEHLQLIQGMNHSRKTDIGVYVELKQPSLHRSKNLDLTSAVLKCLNNFGYSKKTDNLFVQCFEEKEIKRLRTELQCHLPLIQLYSKRPSDEQLTEIARYADGVGINIEALVIHTKNDGVKANEFVRHAHDAALQVHAWTFRTDQLPKWAKNSDDLLDLLCNEVRVDGLFTDQPDVAIRYLDKTKSRRTSQDQFHLLNHDRKK